MTTYKRFDEWYQNCSFLGKVGIFLFITTSGTVLAFFLFGMRVVIKHWIRTMAVLVALAMFAQTINAAEINRVPVFPPPPPQSECTPCMIGIALGIGGFLGYTLWKCAEKALATPNAPGTNAPPTKRNADIKVQIQTNLTFAVDFQPYNDLPEGSVVVSDVSDQGWNDYAGSPITLYWEANVTNTLVYDENGIYPKFVEESSDLQTWTTNVLRSRGWISTMTADTHSVQVRLKTIDYDDTWTATGTNWYDIHDGYLTLVGTDCIQRTDSKFLRSFVVQ